MPGASNKINFVEFVGLVHEERERDESLSIERAVDLTFKSLYQDVKDRVVAMDRAPENDLENRVLRAIVLREDVFMLDLQESVDASRVPVLLDQIQQNLDGIMISLDGMAMTGSQADIIFEKLLCNNLLCVSLVIRKDHCQGFMRAFLNFVRQTSSVCTLFIENDDENWMSEENFQSFCNTVSKSSVSDLLLGGLRVRGTNGDEPRAILAKSILNSSSSIESIQVDEKFPGDFSVQLLSRSLCQHSAIRNLDISFRTSCSNDDGFDLLILNRHPWWKRHLGDMDTVPLKLLPLVLEKADTWECDTSHSHLDVLFFLVKEKNPILLQNVRRRRIRKRKRYGFDA